MPKVTVLVLFLSAVAAAQSVAPESATALTSRIAPGTLIWAEFTKPLDAKRNRVDDPVEAKTSVDLLAQGKIILPRNTKVLGRVTAVKQRTKDSPESFIAITLDRLVLANGQEIPVPMSVQAVAGPVNSFFNNRKVPHELPTSPPPDANASPRGRTGTSSLRHVPGGGPYPSQNLDPVGTEVTSIPGPDSNRVSILAPGSQGAIGLKGILLTGSDRATTISSSTQNLHLDNEGQLLLRTR